MERLVFVSGPMEGRVFELQNPEITVGREPTNRLQLLGDRCVSRRHARFVRQGGALYIEDLGSTNGTMVNGERITGARAIQPGDQVQITYHLMRVEWSPSAFGPTDSQQAVQAAAPHISQPVEDRAWMWGLLPSLLFLPVGLLLFRLTGMQLVPFALVLAGLALAFVGIIRFYHPSSETSTFERAFIQTLSGSAMAILGALWLNAIR